MNERLDILSSMPGIGVTTALMIVMDMPEFGTLDNKPVASPAGFAPLSYMHAGAAGQWMRHSSGNWPGKARIHGGGRNLRHAIFLPTLVAIRINAELKANCDQFVSSGKVKKVAITAVMRKLLVLAKT